MAEMQKNGYLNELYEISVKLSHFLDLLNSEDYSYIKEIAVKLRILYSKSNNISKNNRLKDSLFNIICDLYNINISVYTKSKSTIEKIKELGLPIPLSYYSSSIATWFETGDKLEDLDTALKKESIYFNNVTYSFDEIFRIISDKFGGCHLDRYIDDNFIRLYCSGVTIGNQPTLIKSIVDLAKSSISIIQQIRALLDENTETTFVKKNKL